MAAATSSRLLYEIPLDPSGKTRIASSIARSRRQFSGTPTIYVNGKELKNDAFASEQAFRDAITNPQQ